MRDEASSPENRNALGLAALVGAGVIVFLLLTHRGDPASAWESDPELLPELSPEFELKGLRHSRVIAIATGPPLDSWPDSVSKGYRVRVPQGWGSYSSSFRVEDLGHGVRALVHPGLGKGQTPWDGSFLPGGGELFFFFDFGGKGGKEGKSFQESWEVLKSEIGSYRLSNTPFGRIAPKLKHGPVEEGKVGGLSACRARIHGAIEFADLRPEELKDSHTWRALLRWRMVGFAYLIWDGEKKISAVFLIKEENKNRAKAERLAEAAVLTWRKK
jgi:hypothetical protein